jgi:CHAT domain-containing protein
MTQAVEWFRRALELDRSIGDERGVARDLGGLGGAHFALAQPDIALSEYEASLELREKHADAAGVVWTLIHMGIVHSSNGRPDEALRLYQRAIGGASSLGDRAALATAGALVGSARLVGGGAPDSVLEATSRATELATQIARFDVLAFALTVEGRAHARAGRLDESRAALDRAVEALGHVPVGPSADVFFDDRRGPYLALVDLLVTQKNPAEAYAWLERSRRESLAALLGGDGAAITRGLPQADRDEEGRLLRAIRETSAKLSSERARSRPDASRRETLESEIAALRSQLASLRVRIYAADPRLQALRAQAPIVEVSGAASLLDPREAVVAYSVDDEKTYVFVVSRATGGDAQVEAARIDKRATELAVLAARFKDSLSARKDETDELSRELHATLLRPVLPFIEHKARLVVVPDVFLWGIPFEALRSGSGTYLVERSAVSYVHSLSALAVQNGVEAETSRARVFSIGPPSVAKRAIERLNLLAPGVSLDRDETARRESASVRSLFGPSRSTLVSGAAATPDKLATQVPATAFLHVATPIVLSDASPLHSQLLLSAAGKEDDTGLVDLGALFGWSIPARLAFFSMAESPAPVVSGESLAALSWALTVSGTPAVGASRWAPLDAGTVRADPLVRNFYRALLRAPAAGGQKTSPATALQQAGRALLAAPATRHPHHWARFILIGR